MTNTASARDDLSHLTRVTIEERIHEEERRVPRPLRAIFDARPGRACLTGIGRYARTMAGLLRGDVLGHTGAILGEGRLRLQARHAFEEEIELPALLVNERADVYHSALFRLPALLPCKAVVTVHDAIPLVRPDLATPVARQLFEGIAADVARADAVVCPSQSAKDDLVRTVGVDPARVHVVPETPEPSFGVQRGRDEVLFSLARHGVADEPFVLVVGSLDARKDPRTVLDALRILEGRGPLAVFAGPPGDVDVAAEARQRGVEGRVRVLGQVSDATLAALYAGAGALVHASLYEGFGLPVVEAFSAGAPVVAARAASLPEVVGDAGLLFDPGDAASLAERLLRLRDDEALGRDLARRGSARLAACFSPDLVRARVAAVWERVTAQRSVDPRRCRG